MGLTGSLANRSVSTFFSQEELSRWKSIFEKNGITSESAVCSYYERKGVQIDYGCPNKWPVGGPSSLQKEYFEAKAAFIELNGGGAGGGGGGGSGTAASGGGGDGNADSSGNTNTADAAQSTGAAEGLGNAAAGAAADNASGSLGAARNATDGAVEQATKMAAQAASALTSGSGGGGNSPMAQMKATAASVAASAASNVAKIASFSLPEIKIPKLEVLDPNEYIQKLIDTFDPTPMLQDQVDNLEDQLKKIEDMRESLEGERKSAESAEVQENVALEDEYLEKLKALGGEVDTLANKLAETGSDLANSSSGSDSSGGMAEAMAAAADAAANGGQMDADTVGSMVDSLSQSGNNDSTMKAVFGDASGKAAEAVAKSDTSNNVQKRGNGPCGGRTKNVGGVNHNEPDKSKNEEDANLKAYSLKQFEKACESGDMNTAEKYYNELVNNYGESPSLLSKSLDKLKKTAPQTKAGIARTTDLVGTGSSTVSKNVNNLGSGSVNDLNNSRNMNKSLTDRDTANKIKSLNEFSSNIKNNENIKLVS